MSTSPADAAFSAATANALDFLRRAATQLHTDPKMSIVAFAAGVEVMLKARLLKEHWTLIVDNPEQVTVAAFRAGEFRSISPEQTIRRLRTACGESIAAEVANALLAPSRHRNRVIHFHHPALAGDGDPSELEAIAIEQCRAWAHLDDLLRSAAWKPHLAALDEAIGGVDAAFRANGTTFLQGKWQAIEGRLDLDRRAGILVFECAACHFVAQRLDPEEGPLFPAMCQVCRRIDSIVVAKCPSCDAQLRFVNSGVAECSDCSSIHSLLAMIADGDAPELDDLTGEIGCRECGAIGPMLSYGGNDMVCLACFASCNEIQACRHCGQEWADHSATFRYGPRICAACGLDELDDYESREPWQ